MSNEKQLRISGDWALASDGIQWIVQKRSGDRWRSVKFIRGKACLAYRLTTTLKLPAADAAKLLDGLPPLEGVHSGPPPATTAKTHQRGSNRAREAL